MVIGNLYSAIKPRSNKMVFKNCENILTISIKNAFFSFVLTYNDDTVLCLHKHFQKEALFVYQIILISRIITFTNRVQNINSLKLIFLLVLFLINCITLKQCCIKV